MQNRFALLWKIVGALFVAAGFFGFPLPSSWGAVMESIYSADEWMFTHVEHPTIFMIGVGIFFGLGVIPSAWEVAREHLLPHKPTPNVEGGEAIKVILSRSKHAKRLISKNLLTRPLRYESHLTQSQVIEDRLRFKIVDELHDHLRQGRINAWGSPDNKRPHQLIGSDEWSDIELQYDPGSQFNEKSSVHAVHRVSSRDAYLFLKFDSREVRKIYPETLLPWKIDSFVERQPKNKGVIQDGTA